MHLKTLKQVLPDDLTFPDLPFLRPDHQALRVLLMQPEARLIADASGVRHADSALAEAKCRRFLVRARQPGLDVAAVPEYCFPWETLTAALAASEGPLDGQLWILGCEAITPTRLGEITDQFAAHAKWLHEPLQNLNGIGVKHFVDPVCYVFRVLEAGQPRTAVLIQFKTSEMGGVVQFEAQHLITGNDVYQIRNGTQHSINLITFLCSDVLGWGNANKNELRVFFDEPNPTLLFHLQLNKSGRHPDYRGYRSQFLFSQEQRELVCLNWARNVNEKPHAGANFECWNNDSFSAIYSRQWDQRYLPVHAMEAAEGRGLYFCWSSELRSYVGVLNFAEHCFELTLSKVWRNLAPPMSRSPRCPQVAAVYAWHGANADWQPVGQPLDSEYAAPMQAHTIDLAEFSCLPNQTIAFENLAALSVGKPALALGASPNRWPDMREVDAHQLSADEVVKRTTFAQDTHPTAITFRNDRYTALSRFLATLRIAANLPLRMRSTFTGCAVEFNATHPYSNIRGAGARLGAAIYLSSTALAEAQKLYAHVVNRIALFAAQNASAPNPDTSDIVIWYQKLDGTPEIYPPEVPPQIQDDPKALPAHITTSPAQ